MDGREDLLRRFVEEEAGEGRTVWASFDWTLRSGVDAALEQQGRLAELVDARKLVVKTAAIGGAIEGWSSAELRRAQAAHSGEILASDPRCPSAARCRCRRPEVPEKTKIEG